jgi:Serine dehydrogenase proteinase
MTSSPLPAIFPLIEKLQASRKRPAVFFDAALTEDSVPVLYECLRKVGRREALDLVLSTRGGMITSTREAAMLLHEFAEHVAILVPFRARSAGTLLCLSADELVFGPLAELGPVDSTMDTEGVPPADAPGMISAQDILAFRDLAREWFGVDRPEDRLQVLALLATRIFPTSLSSFYRFDKLVREVAAELLAWQLPGQEQADLRSRIVGQLVSGYHSHDVVLTRRDARALGLRVSDATPEDEDTLWALAHAIPRPARTADPASDVVSAVIAASGFSAAEIVRRARPGPAGTGPGPRPDVRWEIFD